MFKRVFTLAAALFLMSCTVSKPRGNAPSTAAPAPATGLPAPTWPAPSWPAPGTYRVDSSASELRLLVYRTGALASVGHNHVILNRTLTGSVEVATTFSSSSFSLSAPVAAFIIDESRARAEEGDDFAGEISDEAKTGTRNNMMGPSILNAIQYPVVNIRSIRLEQAQGTLTAVLSVSVAGHESVLSAPFVPSREGSGLLASASFELRQSALGLTPFSLMFGALAVRDSMQVKLKIAAGRVAPIN